MCDVTKAAMQTRKLGPFDVSAIGLGCMVLSHAYGSPPDPKMAGEILLKALDLGYTHFDTATLYGFGANETLLGNVLKHRRKDYMLASKCGMFRGASGGKEIDGHPAVLKQNLEDSLKRLQTDVIDLYYLHRWDKSVPIEDSIGAMADMVRQGKVRAIGLSEASAATLRKAHATHPIAAMQSEYSLWTRNPEIAVLDACRDLGVAFVAFSPLARGFLTGDLCDPAALPPKDIRLAMPRFQAAHYPANLKLLDGFGRIARENDCTMAQLALAWLLAKAPHIISIPATTRFDHLAENAAAASVRLIPGAMERMEALINAATVSGPRYNAAQLLEIDTEGN
jgi:aryl-alcohol dehydrogenase-like predicted oxidoreductase